MTEVTDYTEIQKIIFFLRGLLTDTTIVQYGVTSEITERTKVVGVQEVIKRPVPSAWGNFIDYDKETEKATVGYNYRVSYKLHCISYLSFEEADRLADAVERAFKWRSWLFNADRKALMLSYDILGVEDGPYRRPTEPILEAEVSRIVVDIDLVMQRNYTIDVPALTKVGKWDGTFPS
jgi:hypothetical protein